MSFLSILIYAQLIDGKLKISLRGYEKKVSIVKIFIYHTGMPKNEIADLILIDAKVQAKINVDLSYVSTYICVFLSASIAVGAEVRSLFIMAPLRQLPHNVEAAKDATSSLPTLFFKRKPKIGRPKKDQLNASKETNRAIKLILNQQRLQ